MINKTMISFRLSQKQKQHLKDLSEITRISQSKLIEEALLLLFEKWDKKNNG